MVCKLKGVLKWELESISVIRRVLPWSKIIAVLVILGNSCAIAYPEVSGYWEKSGLVKRRLLQPWSWTPVRDSCSRSGNWKTELTHTRFPGATATAGDGGTVNGPSTTLGPDWNSGNAIASGTSITFSGKSVTLRVLHLRITHKWNRLLTCDRRWLIVVLVFYN